MNKDINVEHNVFLASVFLSAASGGVVFAFDRSRKGGLTGRLGRAFLIGCTVGLGYGIMDSFLSVLPSSPSLRS